MTEVYGPKTETTEELSGKIDMGIILSRIGIAQVALSLGFPLGSLHSPEDTGKPPAVNDPPETPK
ncbi:hypothetical protein ACFL0Y_00045 [Patescibacteria group bacterium]